MDDRAEGEGTEEPTPRRLEEARRRGEVALSRDLSAAVGLAAVVVVLVLAAPAGVALAVSSVRSAIVAATSVVGIPPALGWSALDAALGLIGPPLAAVSIALLGVGLVQTRGLVAIDGLRLDPKRVLPSWRRLLRAGAGFEIGKGLAKLVLVGGVAWLTLAPLASGIGSLPSFEAASVLSVLGSLGKVIGLRLATALVALGAVDYLWQLRRHRRALRMTRDAVKREHRETEGDPHHKAERQRLHRELVEQRMLADVRKADFVVVNPEHIAVALRYDRDNQAAPVVVAKGERLLAQRIQEVAREAGVPIFRDVTLARSLRDLEAGDEIPEALYEAVAEILRVVYRSER